jgi:hypothetical protein
MQRTVALQRIDRMRFDVGPESNQLTAIGNSVDGFAEVHSRGVEAAVAASTHAGHKEGEEKQSDNHCSQLRVRTLRKKISVQTGLVDQLNFEFMQNKNSMAVFMIRLRRVYQT